MVDLFLLLIVAAFVLVFPVLLLIVGAFLVIGGMVVLPATLSLLVVVLLEGLFGALFLERQTF